jgi:hypothetical protein
MNEDALIINDKDKVYGVADGATSLTGNLYGSGLTGGYIAAQILASRLQDGLSGATLEEAVIQANDALRQRMIDEGIDIADKRQLWSAAFAVFQVRDTYVEFVQAGDCMLFAKYADGSYRRVTHDQVAHVDRITLAKRREAIELGITEPAELRNYLYPTLSENRQKANTREGYAVLNGEVDFRLFLETGRFSRACLTRLYAVTDGMFHSLDGVNPDEAWTRMLMEIDRVGLEAYAENLVRAEQADADCTKVPRLKISDDKTGIVLDVGQDF